MNRSHQDDHNSTCIKHRLTMSRRGRSLRDFFRHKADGIAVLLLVFVKKAPSAGWRRAFGHPGEAIGFP